MYIVYLIVFLKYREEDRSILTVARRLEHAQSKLRTSRATLEEHWVKVLTLCKVWKKASDSVRHEKPAYGPVDRRLTYSNSI